MCAVHPHVLEDGQEASGPGCIDPEGGSPAAAIGLTRIRRHSLFSVDSLSQDQPTATGAVGAAEAMHDIDTE